jgi:predicted transcriptional regulator
MCRILKPLACGVRLGVFALLDKDNSIEQLAQKSQLCETMVSRHLRVLHGGGLIKKQCVVSRCFTD